MTQTPKPCQVAVIDCGAGNLHSVRKALARELPAHATLRVTADATDIASSTHIVLPGVGAFADCMAGLNALPGMRDALEQAVLKQQKKFLGICVGMQILFETGHEHGTHAGLGWFNGEVGPLNPSDVRLRIPHMGWNRLQQKQESPLFAGIDEGAFVYFVHSFAATGCDPAEVLATVDYGGELVSIVGRKNITATQFHPEKSQAVGLRMLGNFLMD